MRFRMHVLCDRSLAILEAAVVVVPLQVPVDGCIDSGLGQRALDCVREERKSRNSQNANRGHLGLGARILRSL